MKTFRQFIEMQDLLSVGLPWTKDIADIVVAKLGPEFSVIGSVATKGKSYHDLDILRSGTHPWKGRDVEPKIMQTLQKLGFEYAGQSVMNQNDKNNAKKGKHFPPGWSEIHHFVHKATKHKLEIWTTLI